ncbi:MAG: PEP-utilizing enzyme [Candidatus Micrarchaeota archaeon]
MTKWTKWFSREYGVQYCQYGFDCVGKTQERFYGGFVTNSVIIPEQKNQAMYIQAEEWDNFLKKTLLHYPTTRDKKRFFKEFKKFGRKYVLTSKKSSRGLRKKTNAELLQIYENYLQIFLDYTSGISVAFNLNEILGQTAEEILNKKQANAEIAAALLKPSEETEIFKLQKIAFQLKTSKPSQEQLKEIVKQYNWMPCLDIMNDPWTIRDLEEFIANATEQKQTIPANEAATQLGLNKKEIKFFELMRVVAYIKDLRDEYRRKGVFYSRKMYGEIAKRAGITTKQIAYATNEEIKQFLTNNTPFDLNKIKERMNGFALYKENDKFIILTGSEAQAFKQKCGLDSQYSGISSVKGIVGSNGNCTGPAKIIHGVEDLKKIKNGDVMIAITTHPDYVPAMHLAVGIVTDEGGITCHAAIVSRELKKPCIVGTHIGTKTFQDGDVVEVNGTTGEVRKIQ